MRLETKIALITGAGSGFGEGIARTFAREGAKVIIADINEKAARDVAAAIGRDATALRTDVSQRADVDAVVQAALSAFGGLDILVNNAGINFSPAPFTEVTEEQFDRIFAVNVKSIYLFAQAVVPHFRRQ